MAWRGTGCRSDFTVEDAWLVARAKYKAIVGMTSTATSTLPSITEIVARYPKNRGSLISILQDIQAAYGFLSEQAIDDLEKLIGISSSEIYGVATFYTQFRFQPPGKFTIQVCQGTACHVRGAARILQELQQVLGVNPGETTEDGQFTLEQVACLGCCALAPVVAVNGKVYASMTPTKVNAVIEEYRKQ